MKWVWVTDNASTSKGAWGFPVSYFQMPMGRGNVQMALLLLGSRLSLF